MQIKYETECYDCRLNMLADESVTWLNLRRPREALGLGRAHGPKVDGSDLAFAPTLHRRTEYNTVARVRLDVTRTSHQMEDDGLDSILRCAVHKHA